MAEISVVTMYDFTREYFRVPVAMTVNGTAIDPTVLSAEFAILAKGSRPINTDWKGGVWETDADGSHWSKVLVGDATALADGGFQIVQPTLYNVFWRITDNPERPARLVALIKAL